MTELKVTVEVPVRAAEGEMEGHMMFFIEARPYRQPWESYLLVTVLSPHGHKFKLPLMDLERAVEALRAGVGR